MSDSDGAQANLRNFSLSSDIIEDDDVFHPDAHRPKALPERREEMGEIHNALSPAPRGGTPRNAFIYGKPGQGKTVAIKIKLDQLTRIVEMARKQGETDAKVEHIYISCNANNTSYYAAEAILRELEGLDNTPTGFSLEQLYQRIYEYMNENGGTYIIVLDEVDKIEDEDEKRPNIFYELPRARMNDRLSEDAKLSIIGISNNRRFKENLSPEIKDALYDDGIDFNPYTKEELVAILMRRAGKGLVDTEVVKEDGSQIATDADNEADRETIIDLLRSDAPDPVFDSDVIDREIVERCAEHAVKERGSARQAIEYLGKAASLAHDDGSNRITVDHVAQAENLVNRNYIIDMFKDLSEQDLLTLFAVLYLELRSETPARTREIHEEYQAVTEVLGKKELVQRRMRDCLQELDLAGITNMRKRIGGTRGGPRWETQLTLNVKESVNALQSEDDLYEPYSEVIDEIAEIALDE